MCSHQKLTTFSTRIRIWVWLWDRRRTPQEGISEEPQCFSPPIHSYPWPRYPPLQVFTCSASTGVYGFIISEAETDFGRDIIELWESANGNNYIPPSIFLFNLDFREWTLIGCHEKASSRICGKVVQLKKKYNSMEIRKYIKRDFLVWTHINSMLTLFTPLVIL